MGKIFLVLAVLLTSFLLYSTTASSQTSPIEISIDNEKPKFDMLTSSVHNLTVKNNQNKTDFLVLNVKGPYPQWVTLFPWIIKMGPNSFKNITLSFYPTNDVGRFIFEIKAGSIDAKESASKNVELLVLPPEGVLIQDFKTNRQGEDVKVDLTLKSVENVNVEIVYDIEDSEGSQVKSAKESTQVDGVKTISNLIGLQDLNTGSYNIKVSIAGTSLKRQDRIIIEDIKNITAKRSLESNFLYDKITITLINNGNAKETDYQIHEELQKGLTLTFLTEKTGQIEKEKTIIYQFTIDNIEPGASAQISYRIERWPAFAAASIIITISAVILIWIFLRVSRSRITKSLTSGKDMHSIIINIKAPKTKGITDVTVRDWVNPLAKVQKKFEGIKPNIIESDSGTEIKWRLGDIPKNGHKVLHYKIKPVVNAESIKLKEAYLNFKTKHGKYKKIPSNRLTIKRTSL